MLLTESLGKEEPGCQEDSELQAQRQQPKTVKQADNHEVSKHVSERIFSTLSRGQQLLGENQTVNTAAP